MQYKLIQQYPGSPELGTIEWYECDDHGSTTSQEWRGTSFYNSHPAFWEKVVEKVDYEIIDYIDYYGNSFNFFRNGYAINSVKRLSDGEVFILGDLIDFANFGNKGFQKIEKFEIDYFDKTRISAYNSAYGLGIVRWNKAPVKTPLFTTEDGVEMFKGDIYYYIVTSNSEIGHEWKVLEHIVDWDSKIKPPLGAIQFLSKEKAEEYILLNKPCLSLQDLINIRLPKGCFEERLIESARLLVASKL